MEPAQGFTFGSPGRQSLIVLSILIGAGTHLFWDGFTHEYGWAVSRLAFLSKSVLEIGSRSIPAFKFLQHLSTLSGGVVLLCSFLYWLGRASRKEVEESLRRSAKSRLICVSLLLFGAINLGLLCSWWNVTQLGEPRVLNVWLGYFVVGVHSGLVVELILFGIYWHSRGSQIHRQTGRAVSE